LEKLNYFLAVSSFCIDYQHIKSFGLQLEYKLHLDLKMEVLKPLGSIPAFNPAEDLPLAHILRKLIPLAV